MGQLFWCHVPLFMIKLYFLYDTREVKICKSYIFCQENRWTDKAVCGCMMNMSANLTDGLATKLRQKRLFTRDMSGITPCMFYLRVIHKPRSQNFGYFWPPLPPSWSLLLNKAYVIKWSFGQPPVPPQLSTWFMNVPIE